MADAIIWLVLLSIYGCLIVAPVFVKDGKVPKPRFDKE